MTHHRLLAVALVASMAALAVPSARAQDAATIGSAGTASAGDTSASTLGTAGTSTDGNGNEASSLGTGGSAAAADGKVKSDSTVKANPNKLMGRSKAMAQDKGTFSKSRTKTSVKDGELSSDTRTMSHVPGEKPTMSTTSNDASLPD